MTILSKSCNNVLYFNYLKDINRQNCSFLLLVMILLKLKYNHYFKEMQITEII